MRGIYTKSAVENTKNSHGRFIVYKKLAVQNMRSAYFLNEQIQKI